MFASVGSPRPRPGLTLIGLLVVTAVTGVLLALLLPAVTACPVAFLAARNDRFALAQNAAD